MSEAKRELEIRRILVALDASAPSLAALEAAVDLAARMEAELLGLFVEDLELLQLAETPTASEILSPSAREQPLDSSRMERKLKAQAEQAKRALARAAERAQVRWSFRTVRGEVTSEVLSAATAADLLTLGKSGWSLACRLRLGSTARAAAAGASTSLLFAQCSISPSLPVLVVYDRTASARDALRIAAHLSRTGSNQLTVFLVLTSDLVEQEIEAEVTRLILGEDLRVRFRLLDPGAPMGLIRALQSEKGGVLVIGSHSPLLEERAIDRLLHEIDSPVLIIGGRSLAARA